MLILRDSFDFYKVGTDLGLNYWDTVSSSVSLSSSFTRMGQGQSIKLPAGNGYTSLSKSFGANEQTIFIVYAMYPNGMIPSTSYTKGRDHVWRLYDDATIQCSIVLRANGNIQIYQGNFTSGTPLREFKAAYSGSVWTHWQIKVVISDTVGEVHIRKNGNPNDDFAAINLDIQTSGNNYANRIDLISGETAGDTLDRYIDDFILYSGSGAGPWNDWVGDVRAIQRMPNADTSQKQFAANPSVQTLGPGGTGTTGSLSSGSIYLCPVVVANAGTLDTTVKVNFQAAGTGHIKFAVYDSDGPGGEPGTLLATSAEVTNPVIGNNNFTLDTAIDVQTGQTLWWGFIQDATMHPYLNSAQASIGWRITTGYPYASGFPADLSSATLPTTTTRPLSATGGIALTNFGAVNELQQDGSGSYVADSNTGEYDLYDFPALTTTPDSILGVSIRAFVAKSDAGVRGGALTIKSGSTQQDSATHILSTSYENLVVIQDTDPDTAAAWTVSGLNAAQVGPKVAS